MSPTGNSTIFLNLSLFEPGSYVLLNMETFKQNFEYNQFQMTFVNLFLLLGVHISAFPSILGCSSKRLFFTFVPASGYMVRLGEWSPQKFFFSVIDPLPYFFAYGPMAIWPNLAHTAIYGHMAIGPYAKNMGK